MTYKQFWIFVNEAYKRYTGDIESYGATCMSTLEQFKPHLADEIKALHYNPTWQGCMLEPFTRWLKLNWDNNV